MAHHKKKGSTPVPAGNRPDGSLEETKRQRTGTKPREGAPFQEHDPKRRLGGFVTAGEHSLKQPRALNDG